MDVQEKLAKELAEDCGLSDRDAEEIVYYLLDIGLLEQEALEAYYNYEED